MITVTGELGSGKSTIAKLIAKKEKIKYYSTGEILRKIADKMNMSILEINKYAENNKSIDGDIDAFTIDLGKSLESFIMDSRMAWHFIPDSFKVLLTVDSKVAAQRIIMQTNRMSESYIDIEAAEKNLLERKNSELKRFIDLYGVNYTDKNNFDLILDTTIADQFRLSEFIIEKYTEWKTNKHHAGFWISPKRLIPSQKITMLCNNEYDLINNSISRYGFKDKYPISVVKHNGMYYIFDGHKRTSAAIHNAIDFVRIIIISNEDDNVELISGLKSIEFINTSTNMTWIYDWEDAHFFNFSNYPK